MKEQYMPTPAEFKNAKESMTDEQKRMSNEREATLSEGIVRGNEGESLKTLKKEGLALEFGLSDKAIELMADKRLILRDGEKLELTGHFFPRDPSLNQQNIPSRYTDVLMEILEKMPDIHKILITEFFPDNFFEEDGVVKSRSSKYMDDFLEKVLGKFPEIKIKFDNDEQDDLLQKFISQIKK